MATTFEHRRGLVCCSDDVCHAMAPIDCDISAALSHLVLDLFAGCCCCNPPQAGEFIDDSVVLDVFHTQLSLLETDHGRVLECTSLIGASVLRESPTCIEVRAW